MIRSGEKYLRKTSQLNEICAAIAHGLTDSVSVHAVRRNRRHAVAKISDLQQAVTVEEQVAGLDVSVNRVLRLVQVPERAISKKCFKTQKDEFNHQRPLSICTAKLWSAGSGNCFLVKVMVSTTCARENRFMKWNASRRVYLSIRYTVF